MIDAIALWVTSPLPHRRRILNLPRLALWGKLGGDRNWGEILKLSVLIVIGEESSAANS
jgi:hypothetical protein